MEKLMDAFPPSRPIYRAKRVAFPPEQPGEAGVGCGLGCWVHDVIVRVCVCVVLGSEGASPFKEDLLLSKILSNYWYRKYVRISYQKLPMSLNIPIYESVCLFLILNYTFSYV